MFQFLLGGLRGGDEQAGAKPASHRTLLRIEGLEDRCTPALFVVNTVMDTPDANPGNGVAADAKGNTSLRAAIDEGNKAAGPHTITFNLPVGENVIWLGSGLVLSKSYTIDGTGNFGIIGDDLIGHHPPPEREGGGGGIEIGALVPHGVSIRRVIDLTVAPWLQVDNAFRLMTVEKGAVGAQNSLTVRRLDFRYGYAVGANVESGSGGAIHSPNDLTIEGSSFYGNSSESYGGAVRAIGKLAVSDSAFSGNTSFLQGGALNYAATPGLAPQTIAGSSFTFNTVAKDGGAIHFGSDVLQPNQVVPLTALDLAQTDVTDNYSASSGGGIASGAFLFVTGGSVSNNESKNNGGGLFYSSTDGFAYLFGLRMENNQAGTATDLAEGGGIYANFGTVVLDSPFSFSGNVANPATAGGGFRTKGAFIEANNMPAVHDPITAG